MIHSKLVQALYGETTTIANFNYDNLVGPSVLSLLSPYDVEQLRKTALSLRLAGNVKKKYAIIDSIMKSRNFVQLAGGTNRLVYRHLEYPMIVAKVAVDEVGIKDNPAEFMNQRYIKPYCCKVFDVTPCGTVGIFERVERITSRYEYATIAEDIFDMITNKLVGKYILADIGTNFMFNWGIRKGFGPVLLDFPYVYELDGSKIYCNATLENGTKCDGEIDYDDGFNFLYCNKCGEMYQARDLSKPQKVSGLFVQANKKGAIKMKVVCERNGVVVREKNYTDQTQHMKVPKKVLYKRKKMDPNNIKTKPLAVGVRGKLTKEIRQEVRRRGYVTDTTEKPSVNVTGKYSRMRIPADSINTSMGIIDPTVPMYRVDNESIETRAQVTHKSRSISLKNIFKKKEENVDVKSVEIKPVVEEKSEVVEPIVESTPVVEEKIVTEEPAVEDTKADEITLDSSSETADDSFEPATPVDALVFGDDESEEDVETVTKSAIDTLFDEIGGPAKFAHEFEQAPVREEEPEGNAENKVIITSVIPESSENYEVVQEEPVIGTTEEKSPFVPKPSIKRSMRFDATYYINNRRN